MATIRELFHTLTNKQSLIILACSAIPEIIGNSLKEMAIPEETKNQIQKTLEDVKESSLEANRISQEIHDRVYEVIDPDTGKVKRRKRNPQR